MAWWVPIKASLGKALLFKALLKGAHHKYIKRVPIPGKLTKTGKQRYRYFYKLTGTKGGGGVGNHEHFVVGASIKGSHKGENGPVVGHYEIQAIHDDGTITVKHDETGRGERVNRVAFSARLTAEHGREIDKERTEAAKEREAKKAKALSELAEARKHGASEKTIEAAKKRAKALGAKDDDLMDEGDKAAKAKAAEDAKYVGKVLDSAVPEDEKQLRALLKQTSIEGKPLTDEQMDAVSEAAKLGVEADLKAIAEAKASGKLSPGEASRAKAEAEAKVEPAKTKTERFKNSTLEPGEFYKDRDGLWVSIESKVKRMSARDREFEEDAGDPHFADAHSVGTVKLRPATADEKAAFDKWEQEVKAIAEAKKLPENIKGWKDIEVSDETRRSAVPMLTQLKSYVDAYNASPELFDRVAAGYDKASDADLVELAKVEIQRAAALASALPDGYLKSSVESEKKRMEGHLATAESDPAKFRSSAGPTLDYAAREGKEGAKKHTADSLAQAVTGDVKTIADVLGRHRVDIGGNAMAEAAKWRAPKGAERIEPPTSVGGGGITLYVDREGGKVYSWQQAGYDDYRNIVKVADLTPENEAMIERAKEAKGKKPPPRPVAKVETPKAEDGAPAKPAATPAATSGPKLQYRQTRDAGWAVFGPASHVTAGKAHTVHKKDGSTKTEYVHRVSKPFNVDGVPHVYGFLNKGSAPENEPPLRTFARLALKRLRKAKAHAAA